MPASGFQSMILLKTDSWTCSAASRHTITPISYTDCSPHCPQ